MRCGVATSRLLFRFGSIYHYQMENNVSPEMLIFRKGGEQYFL